MQNCTVALERLVHVTPKGSTQGLMSKAYKVHRATPNPLQKKQLISDPVKIGGLETYKASQVFWGRKRDRIFGNSQSDRT